MEELYQAREGVGHAAIVVGSRDGNSGRLAAAAVIAVIDAVERLC